ncbi:hypothetical protein METBIDRAFT_11913 [Metschnikowia bicuspidata var. bicuspidata NRRL YB-4993]|uniref:F-box domain-containing protein n=1 Tax=Metschnikowia bicuspidata var. bicuspidata NRRL YB-4993 TaxID=869754 RepID=A0A1A0HBY9_9ASCO|nr:hypothetical protein METBIDRAFT_11913 [Metschnikowia bicuspidata var. bicuspidata NRRL YB-4993]OBA21392.1 hypothetical protein METBIDRAFT_11913 [Metschnikowia bicuspidata var. bicuspidata NRRL YB-4993]
MTPGPCKWPLKIPQNMPRINPKNKPRLSFSPEMPNWHTPKTAPKWPRAPGPRPKPPARAETWPPELISTPALQNIPIAPALSAQRPPHTARTLAPGPTPAHSCPPPQFDSNRVLKRVPKRVLKACRQTIPAHPLTPTDTKNALLDPKTDPMDPKTDPMDTKVDLMDTKVDLMDTKVDVMDTKVDVMDPNTDPMDPNTDPMDPNTDPMETNTDSMETNTDSMDPNTDPMDPNTDPMETNTDSMETNTDSMDPNTDPMETNTDSMDIKTDSMDTNTAPRSLADLPPRVLQAVLWFLPQQLLCCLARTNYRFYEPCARQLYRNIAIQVEPVLRRAGPPGARRHADFRELAVTTIGGLGSAAAPRAAHARLVAARIHTLVRALQVNPRLAQYVRVVAVADAFGAAVGAALRGLARCLSRVANAVRNFYIGDARLRASVRYAEWAGLFRLRTLVVDDLAHVRGEHLARFPQLDELVVAGVGAARRIDPSAVPVLERLAHIRIRDDAAVYDAFVAALNALHAATPFVLRRLQTFNVVLTHGNSRGRLPFLDARTLVNFQVSLGCDAPERCGMECLGAGLARFDFHALKRLSVVQSGRAGLYSHRHSEKWDLVVFSFVADVLEHCAALFYVSIRHSVPLDGVIADGYEGNYLRKVQLYTAELPRLLSAGRRPAVNLVLPSFVALLACYEQPMNTLLWNGCRCAHCAEYLARLDDYVLHHRYYSSEKHVFKDMQTVQMVRAMAEVLTGRMGLDPNLGDMHCLGRPMRNTAWNFHDCGSAVPFQCLPVKTFDLHDMEDDADDSRDGRERFFDAADTPNDCVFLRRERFFPNYLIVISHFLDDLVRKMINLNRGDAEDADINRLSYENDGWTSLHINKMLINGIDYNFDHEANGTIFYTNTYDDAEPHLD